MFRRVICHSSLPMLKLYQKVGAFLRLRNAVPKINGNILRHGSYMESKPMPSINEYPEYEVTQNEEEWAHVSRLLPKLVVPDPPAEYKEYPSGWKPQAKMSKNAPYYLPRNKNHMIPVYLIIRNRGLCKKTVIKNVQGDIWKLEEDLLKFLERLEEQEIGIKIHEITGCIVVQGDHVNNVKRFFLKKGM